MMLKTKYSKFLIWTRPQMLRRLHRFRREVGWGMELGTVARGIQYEERNGYQNISGCFSAFDVFLESNLRYLMEVEPPQSLTDKLKECYKAAKMYPELDQNQRQVLCEEVTKLMTHPELKSIDRPLLPELKGGMESLARHPFYAFIGIDLETNGLNKEARLEVLEIAATSFDSGSVFHSLVNPGMEIKWNVQAQEVHKIPKEAVVNSVTLPWENIWKKLETWIDHQAEGRTVVLVAHNGIKFDFRIILEKCEFKVNRNWYYLDSLGLARQLKTKGFIEGSLSLGSLISYFNCDSFGESHRADVDVIDNGWVLRNLLEIEGFDFESRVNQLFKENTNYLGKLKSLISESAPKSDVQLSTNEGQVMGQTSKMKPKKTFTYDGTAMMNITDEIGTVKFLSKYMKQKLTAAGFTTILQLLRHLPREYVKKVEPSELRNYESNQVVGVRGQVADAELITAKNQTMLIWTLHGNEGYEIRVTQFCGKGSRAVAIAEYNRSKFLPETQVLVHGTVSRSRYLRHDMMLKSMMLVSEIKVPSLVPIYPSKKTLKPQKIQEIIHEVIQNLDRQIDEDVGMSDPTDRYSLKEWLDALVQLHMPLSEEHLRNAQEIVKFHDMMCLHLLLIAKKTENTPAEDAESGAVCIHDNEMVKIGKQAFPYTLTQDQESSLGEILDDMKGNAPMMRVLQGDVGTGKTIVAFLAMLAVFGTQHQSVLMVPTEILAFQHHQTLMKLVGNIEEGKQPNVKLLTSSTKQSERTRIIKELSLGEVDIIIGTHSLLNKEIQFKSLALMIVDEQHKFGVYQRQAIKLGNEGTPHMLMMSATLIPRSLALIMRGSTSLSKLSHDVSWKKEVTTKIIDEDYVDEMYEEVLEELAEGGRAYIVYPLIGKSKSEKFSDLKAAEDEVKELQDSHFQDYQCGLIHGKMSTHDKSKAFQDFVEGRTQVLISTTVIEVGIDVKEASIMIIHHPERFGLAQIHQLRGRVGRGDKESTCYLVPTIEVPRIDVLADSTDGEVIAHADLCNRGPGDFFGVKQSGKCSFFTFSWEAMIEDPMIVDKSLEWATEFLEAHSGVIPEKILAMMKVQGFPLLDDFEI